MNQVDRKYSDGGKFETTIGKTKYEVVMKFRNEGMSMRERALRAVKAGISDAQKEETFFK